MRESYHTREKRSMVSCDGNMKELPMLKEIGRNLYLAASQLQLVK